MDIEFEQFQYCQDDPVFYTRPSNSSDTSPRYIVNLPPTWHTHRDGEWTMHSASAEADIPEQGWKVHVSATLEDAEAILSATAAACIAFGIAFKHMSTVRNLFLRNSKNYPRGHSGKFLTCYPPVERLNEFLDILEKDLQGFTGPYILSDKRWKLAPIYLRYGAFRRMTVSVDGIEVPAIRETNGTLVPDERRPVFSVPPWAEIPEFLADWIDTYPDDDVCPVAPFNITNAIKFTNGGGTYRGVMKSGNKAQVIVKEARAHAGLDGARRNATDRLSIECQALSQLSDTGKTPRVRWYGTIWEHDFLCIEYINGVTLQQWIGRNFPVYPDVNKPSYYQQVHEIALELLQSIETLHQAGWTHQDLHPRNVIVESVHPVRLKIIDFEGALPLSTKVGAQEFGFPGYRSLRERTPQETDFHGVRQILSYMLLPLINLSELNETYTRQTVEFAQRRDLVSEEAEAFDAVKSLIAELEHRSNANAPLAASETVYPRLDTVMPGRTPKATALIRSTEAGIDWTMRHAPEDTFPTDYEGLADGQHGLAYGAAGITLALATSAGIGAVGTAHTTLLETMISKTVMSLKTSPEVGLFTGLMGDLVALYAAGHKADVNSTLLEQQNRLLTCKGPRIYDGLPGVLLGLTWLIDKEEGVGEPMRERVRDEIASLEIRYLGSPEAFSPIGEPGQVMTNQSRHQDSGLLYGHLGIAWLYATAAQVFSEPRWSTTAYKAIQNELSRYKDENGRLQFEQAGRLLPYLAIGSAGLGMVLPLLPPELIDKPLKEAAEKCLAALQLDFCAVAGLFNGYSGLLVGAAGLRTVLGIDNEITQGDIRALELHALTSGTDRLFGGDSEFRLATDLATGSAGIIFALSYVEQLRINTSEHEVAPYFEDRGSLHKARVARERKHHVTLHS